MLADRIESSFGTITLIVLAESFLLLVVYSFFSFWSMIEHVLSFLEVLKFCLCLCSVPPLAIEALED